LCVREEEVDVVEPFQQAFLFIGIDVERFPVSGLVVPDELLLEVYRNRCLRVPTDRFEEFAEELLADHHGKDTVVERVVAEDIGKEARYHHLEAVSGDCPGGMLAA